MDPFSSKTDDLFDVFSLSTSTKRKDPSSNQSAPSEDLPDSESEPSSKKTKLDFEPVHEIDTSHHIPKTKSQQKQEKIERKQQEQETEQKLEEASGSVAVQIGQSLVKDCTHEVAIPPNFEITDPKIYDPAAPEKPARTWPFTLDPFQRVAVSCLERQESVLVSAHTSAGKTVVAEYAIAMSLRDNQRVIYTSPIKALSNQKYRELNEEFQDVGLMTGDVTISPNASCLVMTTEILRSMLYRGSEIMREVAWVIFDEIHYMRDKERGVVWEETIILLSDKIKYVFLSATIPNAKEFADWIAKLHNQPCHVVYTDYRPTPLQHYIFPSNGDGLHLVVDEKGVFKEHNFQKALATLSSEPNAAKQGPKGKKKKDSQSDCYKIIKMIMERSYDPVIVFNFSKKECEFMALQMSKLDFNNQHEKELVENVFSNAIDSLSEDDQKIPQVEHILPLLKRGIGIHHSGLLPILKEVIEILFQEGLLKALFATETFSIGLNMPAKTVVFTSVRKYDGQNFRWVSSGEYIQMSGRAGRRGLDDRGIVIMMVDEKMEPSVVKGMVKGQADSLTSSFYLGYNMLLNLMRVEGVDPEYLMKRSFHQFQHDRELPALSNRLGEIEKAKEAIKIENEEEIGEYYTLRTQLAKLKQMLRDIINQPLNCLPFLQPGRLVKVKDGEVDWGHGVLVSFQKRNDKNRAVEVNDKSAYIVDVLLDCAELKDSSEKPRPPQPNEKSEIQVVPVVLDALDGISSIRVFLPKDLRPVENRRSVKKSLRQVDKRFPNGIPMLDPIEDMKIESEQLAKLLRRIESIEDQLLNNENFNKSKELDRKFQLYHKKVELENETKELKKQLKISDSVVLHDQLKAMRRVLRRLGYVDGDNVIQTKGRVACEISAADELLLTELIFNGVFNDLEPDLIAALLSCFVFQEKSNENNKLKEELEAPLRKAQETARRIAKIAIESKVTLDEEEYVQTIKPHLMEVVYAWSKGAKFIEICAMTDVFEGSVIRCMRRLEELTKQLVAAAKSIGNTELEEKFSTVITKIKRDIVFAASLYL